MPIRGSVASIFAAIEEFGNGGPSVERLDSETGKLARQNKPRLTTRDAK
jgi:hypothetical protein